MQRQQRLRAIQGLDLGLLVQADDGGVLRRTQVQADDVADLLLGFGIGTEFESLDAVRFETVLLPNPMHGAVRKAGPVREFASTPVREPTGRGLERQRDDLSDFPLLDLPGSTRPGTVAQPRHALLREAAADATDLNRRVPGSTRYIDAGELVGHQQHGSSSAIQAGGRTRGSSQSFELSAFIGAEGDRADAVGHDSPQELHGSYINMTLETIH